MTQMTDIPDPLMKKTVMERMKETLRDRYIRVRHLVLTFLYRVRRFVVTKMHRTAFRIYRWTSGWLATHGEFSAMNVVDFSDGSFDDRYDRSSVDRY